MASNDAYMNVFTTRVRQLILKYQEIKKENGELYNMVDERDKKIAELERAVSEKDREYQALKTAKMIEITDGDIESAKNRVAKLIRDVNQCITLLSDKE
jgi:peptidoglycan hydrolase CwlO-like protein